MKIEVYLLLLFLNIHFLYGNDPNTPCIDWRSNMDQVIDLDKGIEYSKKMLSRVDNECRVRIYSEIAELFFRKLEIDTSLLYHEKAIKYAKNIGANEALSDAYNSKISILIRQEAHTEIRDLLKRSRELLLPFPNSKSWIRYYEQNAYIAFVTSDYYKAIDYQDSTIIAANRSGHKLLMHETYSHLGHCYEKIGDYEKSAKNFIKSLELKEKYGFVKDLGGTHRNLGNAYLNLKYYEKAEGFLKKAISFTRKQDHQLSLMSNYYKLAQCYRFQESNEKAIKALDSSVFFAKKNVDVRFTTLLSNERGLLYFKNYKDYGKAEKYFNIAYTSAKEAKDKELLFESIQSLIELYFVKEQYLLIGALIKELETIKKYINSLEYRIYLFSIYARYYEIIGQHKKALEALKRYHILNDSIANIDVFTKIDVLERQYDTKKKELQIVRLNQQKEEQEQITMQVKNQQYLYLIMTVFLLLLLGIGTWAFRKLQKQQKELKATNQVKNRLFSIISHDLRGMIIPFQRSGKILTYHIQKGNIEKTKELSQALEQNSERLSITLDNLLNWSLEQMNGYKMNPETIDVATDLKEIISIYEAQASYKRVNIELQYQEDIMISMDKGAFHVIFRNLIVNALKYTEDGDIRITFFHKDALFLCIISDTGVGMDTEQLKNLFTLEEKKSTVGTQGEKGTGLGLNLVYRFIQMHNGTIDVSSEKKIGTRFGLRIPFDKINTSRKNR